MSNQSNMRPPPSEWPPPANENIGVGGLGGLSALSPPAGTNGGLPGLSGLAGLPGQHHHHQKPTAKSKSKKKSYDEALSSLAATLPLVSSTGQKKATIGNQKEGSFFEANILMKLKFGGSDFDEIEFLRLKI